MIETNNEGRTARSVATIAAALGLALASACVSVAGHDSGDRYTSADGLFSMKLPDYPSGRKIEDRATAFPEGLHGGSVVVSNVFGEVRAVSYAQVGDDERALLSDPAKAQDALKSILHQDTLVQILAVSPEATMLHKSGLTLADGSQARFALLYIPEGSSMISRPNDFYPEGIRLDAKRAFLLLFHGGLLLTLQAGNDLEQAMRHARPVQDGAGAQDFMAVDAQDLEARKKSLVQLYEAVLSP